MTTSLHHSPVGHAPSGALTRAAAGYFAYHGIWAPGIRPFRNLTFKTKAMIISAAFLMPLMALIGWLALGGYRHAMQLKQDATRQHVEVAYGILLWAYGQETAGKLSRDQAQQLALEALKPLRYDGNEYFWVNDLHPKMIMRPIKPELDGKDLSEFKDPNGLALFQAMVSAVRQEGKGFVAYQWPKPGHDTPVDKISYVQGFAPWGWMIGSGI